MAESLAERVAQFRTELKALIVESLKVKLEKVDIGDAIWLELQTSLDYAEGYLKSALDEAQRERDTYWYKQVDDIHGPTGQSVVERWLLAYQNGEAKLGDCRGIVENIARKVSDEARLEEAKWFHKLWESYGEKGNHTVGTPMANVCHICKRIADLEARVGRKP